MDELPYLLWWTQNEGIRVLVIGFVGAIVGGLFTYWGQSRERKAVLADRRRDQTAQDARALYQSFVRLLQDIEAAKFDFGHHLGKPWRQEWRAIWTASRATSIRVQGELLPDAQVRNHIAETLRFLDNAVDISSEGRFGTKVGLNRLVLALAADAIEVLGTYLRHDKFANPHAKLFKSLRKVLRDQTKWEAQEQEASEAAAREYESQMSEADRLEIDGMIQAIIDPDVPNDEPDPVASTDTKL